MEFRCPYCDATTFELVPDRLDSARCLACGRVSKLIAAPASPAPNKPVPPTGR
jgi:hypothetical protein